MLGRSFYIIKDDTKHTFEVVTQSVTENSFTNKTHAMQKAGMNVSCVVMPVTNKNANKESIKFIGYTWEDGLYERMLKVHQEAIMKQAGLWED